MQAHQLELRNRIRAQMKLYNNSNSDEPRLTTSRLASIVGISKTYMDKISYGTRSCSQEIQFALAQALNCKVDDIFFVVKKYKLYDGKDESLVGGTRGAEHAQG